MFGNQFESNLNRLPLEIQFSSINLVILSQVLSHRIKKSSKIEFNHLLKSTFNGCIYQMVMKNNEWFNVQFGVNYVSIETPYQENESPNVAVYFLVFYLIFVFAKDFFSYSM